MADQPPARDSHTPIADRDLQNPPAISNRNADLPSGPATSHFRAWMGPVAIALTVLLLAGVFFVASRAPLFPVDTWSHWKYGEWIWQHHRLPPREPFSPYSERYPAIDLWWLSQVIGYLVYTRGGLEGIASLYAVIATLKTALYFVAYRKLSGSSWLALSGVVLVLVGQYSFFGIARPQAYGEVCWAMVLVACAGPQLSRAWLFGLPLVIGLWANLHGAFLLGLVMLGVRLLAIFLERSRALRGFTRALRDPAVHRWAFALGLSLGAACVNPYGTDLIHEAATFDKYPTLQMVNEWQAMVPLAKWTSKAFFASVAAVFVTLRLSPRRLSLSDLVLLLLFGVGTWFTQRTALWWMTIWPFIVLPHWAALAEAWGLRSEPGAEQPPRGFRWSVMGAAAVGALVLVLFSDTGRWLIAGEVQAEEKRAAEPGSIRAAQRLEEWLRGDEGQRPPLRVLVYPDLWSDHVLWKLTPRAQVYWYSHWHLYSPQTVADAYTMLNRKPPPYNWEAVLNRTRINAVVLRGETPQRPLADYLLAEGRRPGSAWQILSQEGGTSEDDPLVLLVAVRRFDPFGTVLSGADAARACVGGMGFTPAAGTWGFLGHLPWVWPQGRIAGPGGAGATGLRNSLPRGQGSGTMERE